MPFERAEDFLTAQNFVGSCNFVKKAIKLQEKELKQPRYNSLKELRPTVASMGQRTSLEESKEAIKVSSWHMTWQVVISWGRKASIQLGKQTMIGLKWLWVWE